MISAGHLRISGGTFIQNNYIRDQYDEPLKHVAFQSLPRSRDAPFSAAINLNNISRRPCTKGTRVAIIDQIMAWINEKDPAKAPPVYWLNGLAGLGKTTIAYTICELLQEAHTPFSSFFCSLQLDSRNSRLLITTLCRDLAEIYNSYAASVLRVLEKDSKIVDAGLRIQIDELLAKPWQASIAHRKDLPIPIVVVDALDESDRGTEFLEELLRVIHESRLAGIKFLVTSRLDPKIVDICKSFPPNAVCKLHEVDTANVQSDIHKYLREALPELKDDPRLGILAEQAGGLFIYATTAVRFISPLYNPPSLSEMRSHLQAMLDPGMLSPHAESDDGLLVDELYERILGGAFRDARVRAQRLRILHTIVCAESRIEMSVLADLAGTNRDTVRRVVESLHAVLFVSSKDDCVYWYHASFPDFILSRTRARIRILHHRYNGTYKIDASCDASAHHGVLARRCLSTMQEWLHFNMCNLPSSYLFDSEVPWLSSCIDRTFSPTLRYMLKHWAIHLLRAEAAKKDNDEIICCLKDFIGKKLLFWMEAMNLIDAAYACSSSLRDAECWVKKGKRCPDLLVALGDAEKFSALFAGSPASKSTPHLYISALSMWHQDSPIWNVWKPRFAFIPSIFLSGGAVTIPLLTISMTSVILCVSFSPDGSRIVSGSYDSVQVWDAKTGKQLRKLQGQTGYINSVGLSPGGNRVVSGCEDRSVLVWDAQSGELLNELLGHTSDVTSVGFSPDGNRIVSGSKDKSVRVWDANTGEQLRELQGHTRYVIDVRFSPDGNQIVSASDDRSVRVWDANAGEQLRELRGHRSQITSVVFSLDGSRILSGSYDGSVRVWDANTGNQLRKLQGHTGMVTSVKISPDGNWIISGSWDRSVRVWDRKTGEQVGELQGHTDKVSSVGFSLDGRRIISGSYDKSMRVWEANVGKQRRALQGHTMAVISVGFSPDGTRIISGSWDSVRVCDAMTGKELRVLQQDSRLFTLYGFSPDGNQILIGSWDSVQVWDVKTDEQRELNRHTDDVISVGFSPDANRIVFGSENKLVQVWDTKTGEQLGELIGHTDDVASVGFSPDGSKIASGSKDNSVRVWHAKTGMQLIELQGHTNDVTSVGFSPDGNRIVSGSVDRSVRVWDTNTGQHLKKLQGHISSVASVGFSPDGKRIVSASHDKSVRVWDANTGEQLRKLHGHTDCINCVAFSPDGNRIVSGSEDKSVRVWANLDVDPWWDIQEDGWIVSGAERVVWVPSPIPNLLLRPHNTLIISRDGSATISFDQRKLGRFWHECYTP